METTTAVKTWVIDNAHSEVHFKVKHMMVSTVTGSFDEFEGTVTTDGDDFTTANISFSAKTASINTKIAQRDDHLRSDDFFNTEAYPNLTFVSKSFSSEGGDYKLFGDLTIRDVTKEVALDVEFNGIAVDPYGQTKAGFEITGAINRKEFGLKWGAVTEAGSVVVADKVKLDVNVQLLLQA